MVVALVAALVVAPGCTLLMFRLDSAERIMRSNEAANRDIEQDRLLRGLDELDAAETGNDLSSSELEEIRSSLEWRLAQLLEKRDRWQVDAGNVKSSFGLVLLLALLGFGVAAGLYYQIQRPYWDTVTTAEAPATGAVSIPAEAKAMVARLAARLEAEPDDLEGWKRMARSYEVMRRDADALAAYRRAVVLAPKDLPLLQNYLGLLRRTEASSEDSAAINSVLAGFTYDAEQDPHNAKAWSDLARANTLAYRLGVAAEAWKKALELTPNDPALLSGYAATEFLRADGEPNAELTALYERLLEHAPLSPVARWYLGFAAYREGRLHAALSYWEPVLAHLPTSDPGYPQLAGAVRQARQLLGAGSAAAN